MQKKYIAFTLLLLSIMLSTCGPPTPEDVGKDLCACMRKHLKTEKYGPSYRTCVRLMSAKYRIYKLNNYNDYHTFNDSLYFAELLKLPRATIDSARIFSLEVDRYMRLHCCDGYGYCPPDR